MVEDLNIFVQTNLRYSLNQYKNAKSTKQNNKTIFAISTDLVQFLQS